MRRSHHREGRLLDLQDFVSGGNIYEPLADRIVELLRRSKNFLVNGNVAARGHKTVKGSVINAKRLTGS